MAKGDGLTHCSRCLNFFARHHRINPNKTQSLRLGDCLRVWVFVAMPFLKNVFSLPWVYGTKCVFTNLKHTTLLKSVKMNLQFISSIVFKEEERHVES